LRADILRYYGGSAGRRLARDGDDDAEETRRMLARLDAATRER
jgi:hypothetical protein